MLHAPILQAPIAVTVTLDILGMELPFAPEYVLVCTSTYNLCVYVYISLRGISGNRTSYCTSVCGMAPIAVTVILDILGMELPFAPEHILVCTSTYNLCVYVYISLRGISGNRTSYCTSV